MSERSAQKQRPATSTANTQTYVNFGLGQQLERELATIQGYASRREIDTQVPKLFKPTKMSLNETFADPRLLVFQACSPPLT